MRDEINRLNGHLIEMERPQGLLAELVVTSDSGISEVIERTKSVLLIVLSQADPTTLDVDQWIELLPNWLTRQFSPEISREEAELRRQLPLEQRILLARHWTLRGWVYWFQPSIRPWSWWHAEILTPTTARVQLVVAGFPYPSGAIEWLLLCAGAQAVSSLE